MKKINLFLIILFFAFSQINAQEYSQTVDKGFIIISAGKNYDAMKILAQKVAQKLNYELNLRELIPNETTGLTYPKNICNEEDMEYPWYSKRGFYDEGEYVSIEYTTDYDGFTPNLYIIVVSNHDKGSQELTDALTHVKKYYKSAYIKYSEFYMGCLH